MDTLPLCLVLCFLVYSVTGDSITGNYFTPCSLKDPQIESCILTQAKALWPKIVSGVPEWGLPSLDPVYTPLLALSNSGNKAINVKMSGMNLTFTGYKDIEFQSVRADVNKLHFEFLMQMPDLGFNGQYEMKGKLLFLPISGTGDFDGHHLGQHLNVSFDFKRVEEGGKKMLQLENITYEIVKMSKVTFNFGNLFGNKALSENTNRALNQNWKAVFAELKERVEGSLAMLCFTVFEPMFEHLSITDLFTDVD